MVTTMDLSLDFMDLHILSLGTYSRHRSSLVVTFIHTHIRSITAISAAIWLLSAFCSPASEFSFWIL